MQLSATCLLKLTNINIHALFRSLANNRSVFCWKYGAIANDVRVIEQRGLESTYDRSAISLQATRGQYRSIEKQEATKALFTRRVKNF